MAGVPSERAQVSRFTQTGRAQAGDDDED